MLGTKESCLKELKGSMRIMSHLRENIKNRNYKKRDTEILQ